MLKNLLSRRGATAPGVIHAGDRKLQQWGASLCGTPWPARHIGPRSAYSRPLAP